MPSRFTWQDADVYLPLKLPGGANDLYDPTMRLRPGVTHAAANAELQPLLEQFAKETPSHFPKKFRVHVKGLNEQYVSHLGHSLFLLFGAVGLLLVISCANVSILLLARGTARQQELAVRSVIGASRWRIERQLLTEALALSLAGALGGIVLAYRLLSVARKLAARIFLSARSGHPDESAGAGVWRSCRHRQRRARGNLARPPVLA